MTSMGAWKIRVDIPYTVQCLRQWETIFWTNPRKDIEWSYQRVRAKYFIRKVVWLPEYSAVRSPEEVFWKFLELGGSFLRARNTGIIIGSMSNIVLEIFKSTSLAALIMRSPSSQSTNSTRTISGMSFQVTPSFSISIRPQTKVFISTTLEETTPYQNGSADN